MLKWILGAVIIILAWAATLLIGLPLWPAIALTCVVAGLLVTIVVVRLVRERKAARELEKALQAQAADQASSARPDLQAEVQEMQAEFQKAVDALKSSKLARGKGGKQALYALPWYTIIGPPGSGKSTALRNSGLQFPYMSSRGGAVRGIGGTRNCDWWLTNDGVLLDTAGRWTTQDEDRDEWLAFLDMTRRFRPHKPLNGILVAVAIDELGGASEEEVVGLAKQVRERVDEVMERLQMSLPVYVLFTKCDLVPGFVDTFESLDRESRGGIWGVTAPLESPIGEPGELFAQRFEELADALETHSMRRMGEERRIEARERIHAFPQQFRVLQDNLRTFISQLFTENVFQDTPRFRGAYFTSGTQEGRPIDRLMGRMAQAFGIHGSVETGETVVDPKSYFLRDVFRKVVFPDKDFAARSPAEERRRKVRQYATAAAIFVAALLISAVPAWAWAENHDFLDSTLAIAEKASGAADRDEGPVAVDALDPLRTRASELREHRKEGAPISLRFGMYQGETVYPAVRELYRKLLHREVIQPVVSKDLDTLDEFGRRYDAYATATPSSEEHAKFYDRLKGHLVLSSPREEGEPGLDEPRRKWLVDHLIARWAARSEDTNKKARDAMRPHADLYVQLLADDEELLFPRDEDVVQRARNALTRVPGERLAIDQLIAELRPLGYELTLSRMIGTSSALKARKGTLVRGAFTREAWDERVRELLAKPPQRYLGEPWVLGEAAPDVENEEQRQQQLRALREEYFRGYVAEWKELIDRVRSVAAREQVEALGILQELTRGQPTPLEGFFAQVGYNATLPMPEGEENAEGLIAQAREAVEGDEAEETDAPPHRTYPAHDPRYVHQELDGFIRFGVPPEPANEDQPPQPVALDRYLEQLKFVRDALQMYVDDPGSADELMGKLRTARTTVRGLIEQQPIGWRPNFEAILWPPIDSAAMNSSKAVAMSAGRSWCSEVVVPFERTIDGKYPFTGGGHDLARSDFTAFFQPKKGILWSFYEDVLSSAIVREGDTFRFAKQLGRDTSSVYSKSFLEFFDRAQDVTDSFFPPGNSEPKASFDVRIRPSPRVANITIDVDGESVSYENAPERWTRMEWPGGEGQPGASLEIRGEAGMHETIRQEGEWGIFRLLEAGTVESRGGGVFTVVWGLHTHDIEITIDFRPARDTSPFFGIPGRSRKPALMQPARALPDVPREIVVGKQVCPRRR